MDDFKIGDDFDENGNAKEHKMDKKVVIAIVVVISIVIGLLVFFISNAIFGGHDEEEPVVDKQVPISDENVKILYKYVSYDVGNYGNDKLLKGTSIQASSLTDEDKLYYALYFIPPEDLTYSGKLTEEKQKIYDLSVSKIKKQLPRFFGKDVSFTPPAELQYKFNFTINDLGVAKLTYSEEEEVYKVVFSKDEKEEELIKPYYTELSSATKKANGDLIINEKVIYTTSSKEGDTYKINIYKDANHTTLIEMIQSVTEEDLKANPISITKYKDKAATVSYTFKVNDLNKNYYFDSSTITY